MARNISIARRRPNLVDLVANILPSSGSVTTSLTFQASTSFDGSYTTFATIPVGGFASPKLYNNDSVGQRVPDGTTRFLFDPVFYSLVDTTPIYIKYAPVSISNTTGTYSAIHVVLPYSNTPNRSFVMRGTFPASSLEIQLPMTCNDFRIQNESAVNLLVAFEPGGTEYAITPNANGPTTLVQTYTSISQIFIHGNAGTALGSAIFTERNNSTY